VLETGAQIPDATVWTAPRQPESLRELTAGRATLVVFYLFDWSSTWTDELGLLRDRRDEFEAAGVQLLGISRDSPYSHIAWAEVLELDFPLLSDWNAEAVESFDIVQPDYGGGMQRVPERSAFLADSGGTVRAAWRYETSEVPDVDELLTAARAL
jgi:mycoredoxin-dependent peroxiredoxin